MTASVLYLVDASPYVFRAYFALPDTIRTPDDAPANATYGFADFLAKLTAIEELTHLAVTFDESLTTSFRNELYSEYKAQRDLPPPELVRQLEDCRLVAEAFGAATFASERFEADDLIGTLASRHRDEVDRIVVVSGDKDLAQLVDEKVTLFDFARDRRFDGDAVRDTFGVDPRQIADYLGLVGDAVDNIPGVRGIGRKTAEALLAEFESLETILESRDTVETLPIRGARSVAAKLAGGREIALLSKRLATIVTDAPVDDAGLEALRYEGADRVRLESEFDRLGFGRVRDRVVRWKNEE